MAFKQFMPGRRWRVYAIFFTGSANLHAKYDKFSYRYQGYYGNQFHMRSRVYGDVYPGG
jgi:hypothetical protein